MKHRLAHLLILSLLFFAGNGFSQNNQIQCFKLNNQEADQLYRRIKTEPDSSFFHTIVKREVANYETGHYLFVSPKGENAEISLHSSTPIRIYFLKTKAPLSFLVKDELGQNLDSVEVFLDKTPVKYNRSLGCYYRTKIPKFSILEVRIPGHSAYFELTRNQKKGFPLKRPYLRFASSQIGRWVTLPIRIAASPIGFVYRGVRYHRWYYPWRRWIPRPKEKSLQGYLALNQPIYRPGDTLHLKAYASNHNGKPLKRDLFLSGSTSDGKGAFGQTISSDGPGNYRFDWPLGDSLGIDKHFYLRLSDPKKEKRNALAHSFRIEDYELDEVVYGVSTSSPTIHKGEKSRVFLSAQTTNQLPVPNAQAELFLLSGTGAWFHEDQVLLPDTLWRSKENLGVRGEWSVQIPDSLIPPISGSLRLHVYFNNSTGELSFKELNLYYNNYPKVVDNNRIVAPNSSGYRSADSIQLELINPSKLPIWFRIKKGKALVAEGFTQDSAWFWKRVDRSGDAYEFSYQYLLDDELEQSSQEYRHYSKALNVDVQGPDRVFPGQEADYQISVTRGNERPARRVDLSAGAINAQFGNKSSFTMTGIGYKRKFFPNKASKYRYEEPELKYSKHMSYFLVKTLNLQDSSYYQYRHSRQLLRIWRDSSLRRDSFYQHIAQFAPFLVKGGKMQPIYLIYVNRKLVYYYDTQEQHHYSFAAPVGYNQITIRGYNFEYTLDSVYLHPGEKQELVINEDYWGTDPHQRLLKRTPQSNSFTGAETKTLERSIFVLNKLGSQDSVFIWDSPTNIHLVTSDRALKYQVGPFPYGALLNYVHVNYFDKKLLFEPGFRYDVDKGRERLYQYQLFPPNMPYLPLAIPHPAIGQYLISPQSVRLFSPPRLIITFDPAPNFGNKGTGDYQFEYPQQANLPDSAKLLVVVLQHLASGEQWLLRPDTRYISNLSPGQYKLFLFNQQREAASKYIWIHRDTLNFERLNKLEFLTGDSLLAKLLKNQYIPIQQNHSRSKATPLIFNGKTQFISGKIVDDNGEPLIGVSILAKGTTIGTVSDIDGTYHLEVPIEATELVFSYTGYTTQEYSLGLGNNLDIKLETSADLLSEVVVTGLGSSRSYSTSGAIAGIEDIPSRRSRELSSISLDKTKGRGEDTPEKFGLHNLDFLADSLNLNSIRTHFRDYAYWEPTLRSNREGKAFFKVKFPEDITNWKSFVIAADKKLQAGLYQGSIQAYKPLMAQLNLPRFLVQGDQTTLIGRVLNYSGDTLALKTTFWANGSQLLEKTQLASDAGLLDQTSFRAPAQSDSLQFSYSLQMQSGYQDGEQRSIPLRPVGTLESDGVFLVLERDTVLDFRNKRGTVHFRAEPSILSLLLEDIEYLRFYPYGCNEQNASKLMGLMAEKQIRKSLNQSFEREKTIQDLLSRLKNAQNKDGSWGWWSGNDENAWISNYVLQALVDAQKAGYTSPALENGLRWLTSTWPKQRGTNRLHSLQTLILAGQRIDTTGLRDTLNLPLNRLCDRLLNLWIKQALGFAISLDSLNQYRYQDVYGGVFWEDKKVHKNNYDWNNNRLINTLLAYQIAQKAGLTEELKRIRTHLLINRGYIYQEQRSLYGWYNTLEVASVLKTILPDLLEGKSTQSSRLNLSGALSGEVYKNAIQATFDASQSLTIKLNGPGPFFCTAYQQTWNPKPQPKSDLFAVKSHLEQNGEEIKQLQFGKPAQLVVEIEVKQEAQYAMIEIPIPAGCSYFKKEQSYRMPEVHREYFAEKVSIFCESLPIGKQRFVVDLEPRFSGTYTLNPVRVEEMYFPVLYGRNGVEKVQIRP